MTQCVISSPMTRYHNECTSPTLADREGGVLDDYFFLPNAVRQGSLSAATLSTSNSPRLERPPVATPAPIVETPSAVEAVSSMAVRREGIYEVVDLDQLAEASVPSSTPPLPTTATARKQFSRAELAQSIQRLRAKGKSFEEIALGLNRLQVAPLSGQPLWTAPEVQSLLPALVSNP